jgi:hypothetical protein
MLRILMLGYCGEEDELPVDCRIRKEVKSEVPESVDLYT